MNATIADAMYGQLPPPPLAWAGAAPRGPAPVAAEEPADTVMTPYLRRKYGTAENLLTATAKQLGEQVAKGLLPLAIADASLVVFALRAERAGEIEGHGLAAARAAARKLRDVVGYRRYHRRMVRLGILDAIRPLLSAGAPARAIRARGHHVNGLHHFPFTEPEVDRIVALAMRAAMPPPAPPVRHAQRWRRTRRG